MTVMMRSYDRPWCAFLVVAIAYASFIVFRLSHNNFDPSVFVTAGDRFCEIGKAPGKLSVLKNSDGYDGQFYYRLSRNPFTNVQTDFGIRLDAPPYRYQRILYPLVVWSLSFGKKEFVPWVMILVNFLALCLMAWISGCYLKSEGIHSLLGAILPLYPGFLLTLSRDCVEISEVCLLLGALFCVKKTRHISAAILLSLAVLAKETALGVVLMAGLLYIWERLNRSPDKKIRATLFFIPLLVWAIWQVTIYFVWGDFSLRAATQVNGWPLVGFIQFVGRILAAKSAIYFLWLTEVLFIIFSVAMVVCAFPSYNASHLEKTAWIFYTALGFWLTRQVWVDDWSFMRAFADFGVLGPLIVMRSKSRIKVPCAAATLLLWVILASIYGMSLKDLKIIYFLFFHKSFPLSI